MYCGFDFGTSNCLIGYDLKGEPTLIPIDGQDIMMPSSIWSAKNEVKVKSASEMEVDRLYETLIKSARKDLRDRIKGYQNRALTKEEKKIYNREATKLSKEVRRQARETLKREAAQQAQSQYESQGVSTIKKGSIVFGNEAIASHIMFPGEGLYFKSPKTYLGSVLKGEHRLSFLEIVTKMVAHIKRTAEQNSQQNFESVVFGRPVNYGITNCAHGNQQALRIMTEAAKKAGFSHIEFEYEPVAAAIDFERTLRSESRVLVIDIGGGTTDITMMRLSKSSSGKIDRTDDILASTGDLIGGNDFDVCIALYGMCRYLGKKSLARDKTIINPESPIDNGIYVDATSINDLNCLTSFRNSGDAIQRAISRLSRGSKMYYMVSRLKVLHQKNLVYRFNNSAELAKIRLSEVDTINETINYLGSEFTIPISRMDLSFYISLKALRIREMINEVISASGTTPDHIYFTGGSAKSPTLLNLLIDKSEQHKIVSGDNFSSVARGLVLAAQKRFH